MGSSSSSSKGIRNRGVMVVAGDIRLKGMDSLAMGVIPSRGIRSKGMVDILRSRDMEALNSRSVVKGGWVLLGVPLWVWEEGCWVGCYLLMRLTEETTGEEMEAEMGVAEEIKVEDWTELVMVAMV